MFTFNNLFHKITVIFIQNSMNTLSLCMIVKNEEEVLARCLNSAKAICDEIIIVDTGSTDNTKDIAKKFTNKVYDFSWCDNFSTARNYAFSLATSTYILWLDADDVVPKSTVEYVLRNKQNFDADVYMLKYDISFFNNKPTFSFYRERIIKNCSSAVWNGVVHECITPFGKIERINHSIEHRKVKPHDTDRNLKIYEKIKSEKILSPREQYYYGRELFDHKRYIDALEEFENFVNSNLGWKENVIDALYLMSQCHQIIGNEKNTLSCLFKTFEYDTPRANISCKIGDYFFWKKNYNAATYWYKLATKCEDVSVKGGFVEPIYYNYYPFLQLSCCYYYLGDLTNAIKYNNKASYYLNTKATKNNKKFYKLIK